MSWFSYGIWLVNDVRLTPTPSPESIIHELNSIAEQSRVALLTQKKKAKVLTTRKAL